MRYVGLLLLSFLAIGCGTTVDSNHGGDPARVALFSPPTLNALVPSTVPVNSVPFAMVVKGTNFGASAIVFWNGTPLNTIFVSSTELQAQLTPTDLMFWGMIPVYVQTGGMNSNTVDFDLSFQ